MSTLWQGPDLRTCTQGVSRRPQDGDAQRDSKRLFCVGYEPELREYQPVLELAVAVRRLLLGRGGEPILGKHLGDDPASCRLYRRLHRAVDETWHRALPLVLHASSIPTRAETELWSQKERGGRMGRAIATIPPRAGRGCACVTGRPESARNRPGSAGRRIPLGNRGLELLELAGVALVVGLSLLLR